MAIYVVRGGVRERQEDRVGGDRRQAVVQECAGVSRYVRWLFMWEGRRWGREQT